MKYGEVQEKTNVVTTMLYGTVDLGHMALQTYRRREGYGGYIQ